MQQSCEDMVKMVSTQVIFWYSTDISLFYPNIFVSYLDNITKVDQGNSQRFLMVESCLVFVNLTKVEVASSGISS